MAALTGEQWRCLAVAAASAIEHSGYGLYTPGDFASVTLHALTRKGLLEVDRNATDRRRWNITAAGRDAIAAKGGAT